MVHQRPGCNAAKLPIAVRKQKPMTIIHGQAVRKYREEIARSKTASGPR